MHCEPLPSPHPTVDTDLPCVNCGYNLNTLGVDARCPECGASVGASLPFGPAHLKWLQSIETGASDLRLALLLGLGVLLSVVAAVPFGIQTLILGGLFFIGSLVVALLGTHELTARVPFERERATWTGLFARIAGWGFLVAPLNLFSPMPRLFLHVTLVCAMAWAIGVSLHVRRLAGVFNAPTIARLAQWPVAMALIALAVVLVDASLRLVGLVGLTGTVGWGQDTVVIQLLATFTYSIPLLAVQSHLMVRLRATVREVRQRATLGRVAP